MKKGQIHMMETAMVILVFFILLTIGFVFLVGQSKAKMKEKVRDLQEKEIIKKSQILNFLPELQCSFDGIVDSNCYDLVKINRFMELRDENDFYYKLLLGNIKLDIEQFDPSPETNTVVREWEGLIDNPKGIDSGYRQIQYPISIYNATSHKNYFGIITISVYT